MFLAPLWEKGSWYPTLQQSYSLLLDGGHLMLNTSGAAVKAGDRDLRDLTRPLGYIYFRSDSTADQQGGLFASERMQPI